MRDSKLSTQRLLLLLLLGAATFATLDFGIFRSRLYDRWLSPTSIAGFAYWVAHFEKLRPADPARDVLLTGDSRMSEGFSARLANSGALGKKLHFVQAGIPGTSLRSWYYLLKYMDPNANRYLAVVISLPSYREVSPAEPSFDDRELDADILAPIITTRDFIDLADTFPSPEKRLVMWSHAAIWALNYRMDVQDFLLHPKQRIRATRWRVRIGIHLGDEYLGHPESMTGLALNSTTGALAYPSRLTASQRHIVFERFVHPYNYSASAFDAYTSKWLSQICARYAQSNTKIIFVRVPTSPLPQVFHESTKPLAHFARTLTRYSNVTFVAEDSFLNLEAPEYFFDTNHLNALGRTRFTAELVPVLNAMLSTSEKGISEAKDSSYTTSGGITQTLSSSHSL